MRGIAMLAAAAGLALLAGCEQLDSQIKSFQAAAPGGGGQPALAAAWQSGANTIVKTDAGYLAGNNGPILSYKGIPYAAPPVGPLRWKPPQPVTPWQGIRMAMDYGPTCIQGRISNTSSEDCLTLNVWTPAAAKNGGGRLPVIVYIHGGAYEIGTGSSAGYSGEPLAGHGVVVVTINYRLGQFGFFAHPELSAETPDGASGNQAVRDMIQALTWVKTNVSGFGGDPGNVTIMGESAGGTSMGLLLLSPKAAGLFHKAIASSPWQYLQPTTHRTQKWYGRDSAESQSAKLGTLADLRALPADKVVTLARPQGGAHQIVDGVILPDDPTVLLQQGRLNPAKLMIGANLDDGTIFATPVSTLAAAGAAIERTIAPGAAALLGMYGGTSDETANKALRSITGDALFMVGARALARANSQKSDTWMYEFAHTSGVGKRTGFGAFHASDIPYWFRTLPNFPTVDNRLGKIEPTEFGKVDEDLSIAMSSYVLNFAKTGDPNGVNSGGGFLPKWPKFNMNANSPYLEMSEVGTLKYDIRKQQLDAIEKLYLGLLAKRDAQ